MAGESGAVPSGPELIRVIGCHKKNHSKKFDLPFWTDENGYVRMMLLKRCLWWMFGVHKHRIVETIEDHGNIVTDATAKRA